MTIFFKLSAHTLNLSNGPWQFLWKMKEKKTKENLILSNNEVDQVCQTHAFLFH